MQSPARVTNNRHKVTKKSNAICEKSNEIEDYICGIYCVQETLR
jgi:hypothetical protein